MARPRLNDPAETLGPPNMASPLRTRAIVTEFQARLRFLETNYRTVKQAQGSSTDFNQSLKRLRAALSSGGLTRAASPSARSSGTMSRLHPELELVISHHARQFAAERVGDGARVVAEDICRAARHAASVLRIRRGAPPDRNLRHHVEALVALMQQVTGVPVLVEKMRGVDYAPHFVGLSGPAALNMVQIWEPRVSERRIARMVLDARKRIGGGTMRFSDYFPAYGLRADSDGKPIPPRGVTIKRFELAFPIYCPN